MRILAMFLFILLSACTMPKPNMSLEEFEATSTRIYSDVTKKQVILAVEKIFNLADYKDFQISYTANGIKGIRWETLFPNNFYYHWDVTCNETPNGVSVATNVSTELWPHSPKPTPTKEVLNLFYARLDYLLGKSQKWPTCAEFTTREQRKQVEALCSNADDESPK